MPQRTISLKDILNRCAVTKLEKGVAVSPAGIGVGRADYDQNGTLLIVEGRNKKAALESLKGTIEQAGGENRLRILLVAPKQETHPGDPRLNCNLFVNEWTRLREKDGTFVYDAADGMDVYTARPVTLG